MKKSFSYPLPDELYVDSFDLGKKFSAEYDGPEKLKVLVNKQTREISGVDPESYDSVYFELIEVDSEKTPEVSYYILNSSFGHTYEYEEEVLINGDIYQNPINITIWDAYDLYYDFEKSEFVFELIVKTSPVNYLIRLLGTIKGKLNFILSNEEGKLEKSQDLSVSEETLKLISEFIKKIDICIDENVMFMEWKYTNFDTILESILPIPEELKTLLNTYQ